MEVLQTKGKRMKCVLLTLMAILLAFLIVLLGVYIINEIKRGKYIGQDIEAQNKITVSATGEIYAKPDLAEVSFSVITEEKTVTETLSKNSEAMNKILDSIKGQGVEEKDLKTTGFNIYPRYEWHEKAQITPPQGERVLVGYEVRQTVKVKIRDLGKIGDIIQGATDAGANQVGDLRFTIDKEDEIKKEARKQAIDKAKEKANELASQLGVRLVRITNFQESAVYPRFYALEAIPSGLGGEAPEIEPGENLIQVTVSITYEIN